jgi:hypothetical protein
MRELIFQILLRKTIIAEINDDALAKDQSMKCFFKHSNLSTTKDKDFKKSDFGPRDRIIFLAFFRSIERSPYN